MQSNFKEHILTHGDTKLKMHAITATGLNSDCCFEELRLSHRRAATASEKKLTGVPSVLKRAYPKECTDELDVDEVPPAEMIFSSKLHDLMHAKKRNLISNNEYSTTRLMLFKNFVSSGYSD